MPFPLRARRASSASAAHGDIPTIYPEPTALNKNHETKMKTSMKHSLVTALVLAPLLAATASTVTLGDPVPNTAGPPADGGIGYRWTVTMADNDSATFQRHVGAWSWEDNSLFNQGAGEPPVGWTHTSDWVALSLTAPAIFTLRLERQEGVPAPTSGNPNAVAGTASMFPSFSIWAGWDGDGADNHTYNNRGDISWAEDLSYLDHLDNSTLTAVERSWNLPAGNYSIVLGSNAPATDTQRQGYRATMNTIPEPSAAALAWLAALAAFRRRRS